MTRAIEIKIDVPPKDAHRMADLLEIHGAHLGFGWYADVIRDQVKGEETNAK